MFELTEFFTLAWLATFIFIQIDNKRYICFDYNNNSFSSAVNQLLIHYVLAVLYKITFLSIKYIAKTINKKVSFFVVFKIFFLQLKSPFIRLTLLVLRENATLEIC